MLASGVSSVASHGLRLASAVQVHLLFGKRRFLPPFLPPSLPLSFLSMFYLSNLSFIYIYLA